MGKGAGVCAQNFIGSGDPTSPMQAQLMPHPLAQHLWAQNLLDSLLRLWGKGPIANQVTKSPESS